MTTTIRLRRAHTHGGIRHAAGSLLAMQDKTAAWLIEQGVAEAVPAGVSAPVTKSPATAPAPVRRGGCCGWR
jgi:hypothetical protein